MFTSESVTEGHPDKMCDQISDAVLDGMFEQDPYSRVACETHRARPASAVVAGEITHQRATSTSRGSCGTRSAAIGYTDASYGFDGNTCGVITSIDEQSSDIAQGVDKAFELRTGEGDHYDEVGAGDQGMMFGYACDDTADLMPMPIWLAHRLAQRLAEVRSDGTLPFVRPDGKTQVTIEYEDGVPKRLCNVLISTQHEPGIDIDGTLQADVGRARGPAAAARAVRRRRLRHARQPDRQLRERRPARRLRAHGPQDHRRHVRRHGPARRRCIQRQGPDEGRPVGRLRGAERRQERGRRGHCRAVRGAGRVRHRRGAPDLGDGRDVRHLPDRPDASSASWSRSTSTCGRRRSSSGSICGARSTRRPPRTGTSVARADVHVGAHRRAPRCSAKARGSARIAEHAGLPGPT